MKSYKIDENGCKDTNKNTSKFEPNILFPIDSIRKFIMKLDNDLKETNQTLIDLKAPEEEIPENVTTIYPNIVTIGSTNCFPQHEKLDEPIISELELETNKSFEELEIQEFQTKTDNNIINEEILINEKFILKPLPVTKSNSNNATGIFNNKFYKQLRSKANRAIQNQKVFTIFGGYDSVRNALVKRGWVEKFSPNYLRSLQILSFDTLLKNAKRGNNYESVALSKLLMRSPINLLWQPRTTKMNGNAFKSGLHGYRNVIYRNRDLDFTTKEGLIGCIENAHWNILDGCSEIEIPKLYRLTGFEQYTEFLSDYRTVFCLSLLKFISDNNHNCFANVGIPVDIILFAIQRVTSDIKYRLHDYINTNTDFQFDNLESFKERVLWENFFTNVHRIINHEEKFKIISLLNTTTIILRCQEVFKDACCYWPKLQSYGYNNLWILKPGFMCRGYGIVIKRSFEDIIRIAHTNTKKHYIVQKYIERPLLIYKTKFDIRQYMLLHFTEDFTLHIWMYKDCYLRFSSREYQLSELDESVHLTNNSVQRKYANAECRSKKLPFDNMWQLQEFKTYLEEINMLHVWDDTIYSGMKKSIIAIVLSSLEETEIEVNSFELYGCDFLITETYEPILIEINATPDMSNSTDVTAKICPAALEDVVKVVLDYPNNPQADTGHFELIHSLNCTEPPPVKKLNYFEVVGRKIRNQLFTPEKNLSKNSKKNSKTKSIKIQSIDKMTRQYKKPNTKSSQSNVKSSVNDDLSKTVQKIPNINKHIQNNSIRLLTEEFYKDSQKLHPGKCNYNLQMDENEKIILKTNNPKKLIPDDRILNNYIKVMCVNKT